MLVALLAAVPAFADPSVRSKEAEAQQVLGQMHALDADLERAVEQYNSATVRLDLIKKAQSQNAFELTIAQRNLGKSRAAIARRLVSLYTTDDGNSTLEVILGSKSLDDVVTSIDNADRVASLDNRVLHEVETFKGAVKRHQRALAQAKERARQARIEAQVRARLAAQQRAAAASQARAPAQAAPAAVAATPAPEV